MTVISLAEARAEREPSWEGKVVCLGCRHEWEGVGPMGRHSGLQCPSCDLPKGVTKYLFGAAPGDPELQCNCGCEAMTAYIRDGMKRIRCMACGTEQTEALFS